jgi:hypothetical protein
MYNNKKEMASSLTGAIFKKISNSLVAFREKAEENKKSLESIKINKRLNDIDKVFDILDLASKNLRSILEKENFHYLVSNKISHSEYLLKSSKNELQKLKDKTLKGKIND